MDCRFECSYLFHMAFERPVYISLGSEQRPGSLGCRLQKQRQETTPQSVKDYHLEQSLPSRAAGLSQCEGEKSLHRAFRCPLLTDILCLPGETQGNVGCRGCGLLSGAMPDGPLMS